MMIEEYRKWIVDGEIPECFKSFIDKYRPLLFDEENKQLTVLGAFFLIDIGLHLLGVKEIK